MDIDIDMPSSFDPAKFFGSYVTKASLVKDEKLQPHPCGVYFQEIPKDPVLKISAIPYEPAEELGYFKLDFLHLNVYDLFESKDEIKNLLKDPPNWDLLASKEVVKKLFQLSKHYDIISQVKPKNIDDLADVLALIRPGKTFILKLYLKDKNKARRELYKRSQNDVYSFKKAHAYAYAMVVILQLHLIGAEII